MQYLANLFIISTDLNYLEKFQENLKQHHLNVQTSQESSDLSEAEQALPDLFVIDTDCEEFDAFQLIDTIRASDIINHIPIVVLASEKSETVYRQALDHKADDIYIRQNNLEEFLMNIKPLLRLSTMFRELEQRADLVKKFGLEAQTDLRIDDITPYKILLTEIQSGDLAAIETALDGNCSLETCENFFEAEEKLTTFTYDAVVSDIQASNSEAVLSLSSRARNNPRLFNLPMLVLADDSLTNRVETFRRGVTRICNRPLSPERLKMKLKTLIDRQRLRWEVRKALDTTKQGDTKDEASTAYSRAFFDDHFDQQVVGAHRWHKNLSVLFFSVPNIPNIREQFGDKAADHLFQQVFQWIAGLTRIEDTVARYDDHEFVVSLPDTPQEEAQVVMHRIAGILSYTDFAVVDVYQPISVWVEVGMATLGVGDSPESLIKRARHNLD